jgi:hypothetical protein
MPDLVWMAIKPREHLKPLNRQSGKRGTDIERWDPALRQLSG